MLLVSASLTQGTISRNVRSGYSQFNVTHHVLECRNVNKDAVKYIMVGLLDGWVGCVVGWLGI